MENEEALKSLKRELKLTRLCSTLSLILTLCLLIGAGLAYRELQPVLEMTDELQTILETVDAVQPALEQLSELDAEQVNELLEEAGPALEQLSELDTDAINEFLESFDPDELQQTLDSLSSAMETVNSFSEKLGSLGSLFR